MLTAMADPLARIESLTAQINTLTLERELSISRAIAAGSTWTQIARRLGCAPQSAHRRYRWLRHNDTTGEVWHERPFPLEARPG
jgi:FixJ family two-component response regulator